MHKVTSLSLLLLALCASAAFGAGINLSLSDCGTYGGVNAVANCGTNTGIAMSMVGSAVPPAGVNRVVAIEGYLDVRTQSGTINSWWTLDGCRANALAVNADFTGGPFNCNDFFGGSATIVGGVSPVHPAPDRFQIKLTAATVAENPMDPGIEHYLFKVNILRAKSTGAGSCAGCNDGACVVLSQVVLNQPAGVGDYQLTEAINRNWVTYNANANLGACPGAIPPPPPLMPPAPVLASPANQATYVEHEPVLAWNASDRATSYRLQVSTGSAFTAPEVDLPGLTGTSATIGPLAPNKLHFWRVSASNDGGTSAYSTPWSFTTAPVETPPPPTVPVLSAPADGATGVTHSPTLVWFASQWAASYSVQVATDPEFNTKVVDLATITTTSTALSLLADSTLYYWRVRATGPGGSSEFSTAWQFTTEFRPPAPTLVSPLNGASGVPTSPVMTWNAVPGATSYGLQLSRDSNFSVLQEDLTGIAGTTTQLSSLSASTLYYWRVNATNPNNWTGLYSPAWSFATAAGPPPPTAPPAPVLVAPADGATDVPTRPTFRWNASSGAATYGVDVATDAAFTTLAASVAGLTATSWMPPALAASTLYYWRAHAANAGGTSPYSPTRSFRTAQPVPPPAPLLSAPTNGATGVTTSPALVWSPAAGASTYRLQLATDANFTSPLVDQAGIPYASFAVGSLTTNTIHYWRVLANNEWGNSPYSSTWTFTTGGGSPPPPTGQAYMNLSLNDCGAAGTIDAVANCASNDGIAMSMVGSAVAPPGMNRMVAMEAYIDCQTSMSSLSPWWTLDACRSSALVFNADFTAGPFSCHDFWAGQATIVGGISPVHTAPNRFQIKLTAATAFEQPIEPGIEHYLFKVNILRSKSAGTGNCAGCEEGACLVLQRLVLNQPAGVGDVNITTPLTRSYVRYIGDPGGGSGLPPTGCSTGAMPAQRRSWGQIKALFR